MKAEIKTRESIESLRMVRLPDPTPLRPQRKTRGLYSSGGATDWTPGSAKDRDAELKPEGSTENSIINIGMAWASSKLGPKTQVGDQKSLV